MQYIPSSIIHTNSPYAVIAHRSGGVWLVSVSLSLAVAWQHLLGINVIRIETALTPFMKEKACSSSCLDPC